MRARRWSSKVPSLLPVLLMSSAVIFAIVIVLHAEGIPISLLRGTRSRSSAKLSPVAGASCSPLNGMASMNLLDIIFDSLDVDSTFEALLDYCRPRGWRLISA